MNPAEKSHRIIPQQSRPEDRHTATHNDLSVDVYALIHATNHVPAKEVAATSLCTELTDPCWETLDGRRIAPQDVLGAYALYPDPKLLVAQMPHLEKHVRQIEAADTTYPLLMYEGHIIDGMHRLVKALAHRQAAVWVRELDDIPKGAILPSEGVPKRG